MRWPDEQEDMGQSCYSEKGCFPREDLVVVYSRMFISRDSINDVRPKHFSSSNERAKQERRGE
jgi:hypothetical protein